MKRREGFVSNSSSTSFCLIGRPVPTTEKLTDKLAYIGIGDGNGDGAEIIFIDDGMRNLINIHRVDLDSRIDIYEVSEFGMEGTIEVDWKELDDFRKIWPDTTIQYGDCSQNTCDDVDQFIENYIEEAVNGDCRT